MKLYQAIVQNARIIDNPNFSEFAEQRQDRITNILPSGSGFDSGTKIVEASDSRIVFETAFHHINENGFYDGWTEHRVTVKPSFIFGFDITVSGKNKNQIKEYIGDVFNAALSSEFDWI